MKIATQRQLEEGECDQGLGYGGGYIGVLSKFHTIIDCISVDIASSTCLGQED